mgnify:FL=1
MASANEVAYAIAENVGGLGYDGFIAKMNERAKELGAVNATCFDISAACSGFVYAYNTAQAYIAAGMYQNILVIGSETLSGIVNWKDRGSCIFLVTGQEQP